MHKLLQKRRIRSNLKSSSSRLRCVNPHAGYNGGRGKLFRSEPAELPGHIEKTATLPVFRLDDPNIRIETDLACEFLLGFGRIDPGVPMEPREKPVLAVLHFTLRRRSEQSGETVEPVDLDKNRAGFRSTPAAEHGKGTLMRAASEIGLHPKIGA
jgi:hypothetical protein